jgi:hypothetical protein
VEDQRSFVSADVDHGFNTAVAAFSNKLHGFSPAEETGCPAKFPCLLQICCEKHPHVGNKYE